MAEQLGLNFTGEVATPTQTEAKVDEKTDEDVDDDGEQT